MLLPRMQNPKAFFTGEYDFVMISYTSDCLISKDISFFLVQ